MEPKPQPMTKPYKVLSIDEMTRLAATGGIERFYRHRLQTKGGTVLTVDIAEQDFEPDKAEPILAARAKNADAILSL